MFFKKKPKGPSVKYIAYMNKLAKYRVVMTRFSQEPGQQLIVYFFDQTKSEIAQMAGALDIELKNPGELASKDDLFLCSAYDLAQNSFAGIDKIVSMEVHPFNSVNQLVAKRFEDQKELEIEFHLGLDEAALTIFQMDRIVHIMKQMDMEENEPIEHSMITKSIEKGLSKQEQNLSSNHQDIRSSQEDWLAANNT